MSRDNGYKRINFFKGFLTTEKDWNDAERYHIEKRKLHNRRLHSPGIVLGYSGDLRVVSRNRGDLSVEIQAGYAIDGTGNDLILWDAQIKNVNPEEYRLPQTIYVVLRFSEELTDFIAYKENLEYKGHRRALELATVELSQTEPEIGREVELARIYLEKGVTQIRDARDPSNPQPNEIDMRYRPLAGIAGSYLAPAMRLRMQGVLWQVRKTFLEYTRRQILTGHDILHAAHTALMLDAANMVDMRNVFDIFHILVESEGELCLEVDVHHPNIAQKKEFSDFKRHVEILRGLLAERKDNMEAFTNLLAYQNKASEAAELAIVDEKSEIEAPVSTVETPKVADLKDWESVKVIPHPPDSLDLDGITWVLVDQIDILDKESEDKHGFLIQEAKDSYRSRQKLKYPGGTVVEDTGRAQVGGYATYRISNITPGRPVVILRRMDYVYGEYEIEYYVNGRAAGTVACSGTDRAFRWRNWPFMIDADHVAASTLTIKQMCITAGRDVNMFHIWVYQPV